MVERNKKSGGGTPVLVCSLGASPEADSAKSIPLSPPTPPATHTHTLPWARQRSVDGSAPSLSYWWENILRSEDTGSSHLSPA